MRVLIVAGLVSLISISSLTTPAQSATLNSEALNCDNLNDGTKICVINNLDKSIAKIECSGFLGTSALNVPRGNIRPNTMTIVDFEKGKCNKHIIVTDRDGRKYNFDNFDTTQNTKLEVDPN